jgi:hypothetical protein
MKITGFDDTKALLNQIILSKNVTAKVDDGSQILAWLKQRLPN